MGNVRLANCVILTDLYPNRHQAVILNDESDSDPIEVWISIAQPPAEGKGSAAAARLSPSYQGSPNDHPDKVLTLTYLRMVPLWGQD